MNRFGFTQPGLNRPVEYACLGNCKVGFRTASCCCHVAAAVILLGVYAFDKDLFDPKYKPLHILDPKNRKELNQALHRRNVPDSDSE